MQKKKPYRPVKQASYADIQKLRHDLPRLVETLYLGDKIDIEGWSGIVDKKLLPRLSNDFPLVAAICGGGSSGKSTLFNALLQEHVSPTGGTAGINRRMLVAGNADRFEAVGDFADLLKPFGFHAHPLKDKHDLIQPGSPLYVLKNNIPPNVILIDTPDFDTGMKGAYTNRDMAQQALELADILIYIFTNANYNNRDNTDFISDMLTRIGQRKCFLVYRVYASYSAQEIAEHAETVARNLYGDAAKELVLGVYRAEEDNRVAADETFMRLTRVGEPSPLTLRRELERLDAGVLRNDLVAGVLADALAFAGEATTTAARSRELLDLYGKGLRAAQSRCVQESLQHFPMEPVLRRFMEIWFQGDPAHVRLLRKAGSIVEIPLRVAVNTAKWVAGKKTPGNSARKQLQQFSDTFEEDLLAAINSLWHTVADRQLSVVMHRNDPVARDMLAIIGKHSGNDAQQAYASDAYQGKGKDLIAFTIASHPVVGDARQGLRQRDWKAALTAIAAGKDALVDISSNIDRELSLLADRFREKMGLVSRLRQTFSALLTVLPATAAITYILSTGDPVGAVGIKVKLTGLFGLKDLYALVAIPATTGLKKADQKQLETMLVPITRTWLNDKLVSVQTLFEAEITGGILAAAGKALDDSGALIREIEDALGRVGHRRREG